jgi:DNA-binding transcriptional regulator LsrR (DeoR family)
MSVVETSEAMTSGRTAAFADVVLDVLASDEQRRTRIAWLYYVEGKTQAEIALRLGLSRVKVNRELAICRESGMVQIRINSELASCVALERALERRFGLVEAVVVPTPDRPEEVVAVLGIAVGVYVGERLAEGQTVAIGWGRTLRWSVRAMRRQRLERITVVSLLGGLGRGSEINTYETAARLADVLGAQCYYLAAPTFVSTPELRDMLLAQTELRQILQRARAADLAVVSVGSLGPESTNRRLGLLTAEDSASLAARGAVGDLLGHLLDDRGRIVDHPLNHRVVGLPPADLGGVPISILASGGTEKVPIIRGALRAGYVNRLITDERTAELLAADTAA